MNKHIISLCVLTLLSINTLKARQNPIDSLKNLIENTRADTVKVNSMIELANILRGRDNEQAKTYADQALLLAGEVDYKPGIAEAYKTLGILSFMFGDFDKAFENTNLSKETYQEIGDKQGEAACYVNTGIFNRNLGNIQESGDSYRKALDIYKETDDKEGIAKTYLNIGNLYRQQGDHSNALDNYLNSLKFYEAEKNETMSAKLYQNIGGVYCDQNDFEKALENYDKSLLIFKKINEKQGIAEINNNIGDLYNMQKEYETAGEYFLKSLKLFEEIGYTPMIAYTYYNLGDTYNKLKNYDEAKKYFDTALEIYESIDYSLGIAYCYNGLGEYYYNLKDYGRAAEYLEKAKEIAIQTNLEVLTDAVEYLSKVYAASGNFKKAYENHVLFKKYNDSIFNENNEKTITALSMQYEFEKKERIREIELQKKEQIREAKQREKDKWDLRVKASLTALVVLMLVIALISIINYRRKVKANKLLKSQKEEIEFQKIELEQRNEEIEAQKDEIEDKNILITEQRDIALKQKQEITDSIHYAQRIQEAVLPDISMYEQYLDDFFIYYRPKDIVSGDFYWMTKANGKLIVTAADCTGHGVPGAFMSLLGLTFLNEIVNKDGIIQANEILNRLRQKVIESLHQKDRETKDGMDIAISIIDPDKKEIQYAGAYNPLYFIPGHQSNDPKIQKIPADRMPIGLHLKMDKTFKNNIIKYKNGDSIYMFSDGYHDQFGGEEGRKLKTKGFQDLILKVQDKPMTEQKAILHEFFIKWKGDLDQLDDIIIIGLKL